MIRRTGRLATLVAGVFLAFSLVAADHADARRGGSFGSRGTRTFQSAPPTRTAPAPAAPVERSMTPRTTAPSATTARQPQAAPQRPGFLNGFGGTLMRGLFLGGLLGLLFGAGFGGLAGFFGLLLQVLVIGGLVFLLMRLFRSRPAPEPALAGMGRSMVGSSAGGHDDTRQAGSFRIPAIGGGTAAAAGSPVRTEEIRLSQADLDTFERRLAEVQDAFGREDHAALRRLATPEMVSYLSEELADNAKRGVRNEVSDIRLLQADIAESWREGPDEYATAAMLYEVRDVTVDRASGQVVGGDPERPTETTELWTFRRENGGDWKLSAIQEVRAA